MDASDIIGESQSYDVLGRRDFTKNMITGTSLAALIRRPPDGNFKAPIRRQITTRYRISFSRCSYKAVPQRFLMDVTRNSQAICLQAVMPLAECKDPLRDRWRWELCRGLLPNQAKMMHDLFHAYNQTSLNAIIQHVSRQHHTIAHASGQIWIATWHRTFAHEPPVCGA